MLKTRTPAFQNPHLQVARRHCHLLWIQSLESSAEGRYLWPFFSRHRVELNLFLRKSKMWMGSEERCWWYSVLYNRPKKWKQGSTSPSAKGESNPHFLLPGDNYQTISYSQVGVLCTLLTAAVLLRNVWGQRQQKEALPWCLVVRSLIYRIGLYFTLSSQ